MFEIFVDILLRLLPLYLLIFLGYIGGKYFRIERASLASLLLYLIVPIVVFRGIFLVEINSTTLTYPIFYFLLSVSLSLSFYFIGKKVFNGNKLESALLSMACSLSNVGYFGIPLVLIFLGEEVLGTVVLMTLGFTLHENTLAYFLVVRGVSGAKKALMKTLRLPTVYASVLAIIANQLYYKHFLISNPEEVTKPIQLIVDIILKTMDYFVGALTVLGMLMVGLGISTIKKIKFNWTFINLSLLSQFIIYPSSALLFIYLNQHYLHVYESVANQIIFLMSLVPIGVNTITIASKLKVDNGSLSLAVLLSTFLSLFIIPFAITVFGKFF